MEAENKQLTRRAATQPRGRAGGRGSGPARGQEGRKNHRAQTGSEGRALRDGSVPIPGPEPGPAQPGAPSPRAHPPLRPRPRALTSSALSSSIAFLLMVPGGGARSSAPPRGRSEAALSCRRCPPGRLTRASPGRPRRASPAGSTAAPGPFPAAHSRLSCRRGRGEAALPVPLRPSELPAPAPARPRPLPRAEIIHQNNRAAAAILGDHVTPRGAGHAGAARAPHWPMAKARWTGGAGPGRGPGKAGPGPVRGPGRRERERNTARKEAAGPQERPDPREGQAAEAFLLQWARKY